MVGTIRQGSHTVKYTLKLQECQTPVAILPERDAPWRHNNGHVCCISISVFCKTLKNFQKCKLCSFVHCGSATKSWISILRRLIQVKHWMTVSGYTQTTKAEVEREANFWWKYHKSKAEYCQLIFWTFILSKVKNDVPCMRTPLQMP